MGEAQELKLMAYRIHKTPSMPIVPAPALRSWMSGTHDRFAYRCLPLNIANQCGWFLLNTHKIRAVWNGGAGKEALTVVCKAGPKNTAVPAMSHFGDGVLTGAVNYLFRTPPGYNLWARGPANFPKDGISPLEGSIGTDWSAATFTMNWKMTTVNMPVDFEIGEPICMISPVKRGESEAFLPEVRDLDSEPELKKGYEEWSISRSKFNTDLALGRGEAMMSKWQKEYLHGLGPRGMVASQHQVKLEIKDFQAAAGMFDAAPEAKI